MGCRRRGAVADTGEDDEIERRVALRMARQEILTGENPPDLWLVLSEAALQVRVGTTAVMRGQFDRLVEAARLPNVTLQVLPSASDTHANLYGPFHILAFPERSDPETVYLEHLTGSLFLEREEEVHRYTLAFNHLRAEALGARQSVELIRKMAGEP